MFNKKTIRDIKLTNKTVLLRADYNVPVKDGRITDDYRIEQSLPTLHYLLEHKARVIIISHLGRPDGKPDPALSLWPVAKRLDQLLKDVDVSFVDECIGDKAKAAVTKLRSGQVLLLENLRFYDGEDDNDPEFAVGLAELADIFVQDGFGVVHRKHASTAAITKLLPSVAGLLVEKEVEVITKTMAQPERPLTAIIGGAKISDKIDLLHKFIEIADFVAIGGAMANTFLKAQGVDVAKSLIEKDEVTLARSLLEKAKAKAKKQHFVFYIPHDGVVARTIDQKTHTRIVDWDAHVISSIEHYPKRPPHDASRMHPDEQILDIGPFSASFIAGGVQLSHTVIWNGTMGVTEVPGLLEPVGPFTHGTEVIVGAILGEFGHKPFSVVGGGDTVGYIEQQGLSKAFGHVSTGGGASLELMAGRTLPGVASLADKEGVQ